MITPKEALSIYLNGFVLASDGRAIYLEDFAYFFISHRLLKIFAISLRQQLLPGEQISWFTFLSLPSGELFR